MPSSDRGPRKPQRASLGRQPLDPRGGQHFRGRQHVAVRRRQPGCRSKTDVAAAVGVAGRGTGAAPPVPCGAGGGRTGRQLRSRPRPTGDSGRGGVLHTRELAAAGKLPTLPGPSQLAADRSYFATAAKLAEGLARVLDGYEKSTDAQRSGSTACGRRARSKSQSEREPRKLA